jgi:hypothetical protein
MDKSVAVYPLLSVFSTVCKALCLLLLQLFSHITLSLNYFQGRTENELFELEMLAIRVFYTPGNWLLLNVRTVFKQN